MLNKEHTINIKDCPKPKLFSLVFGNEARGLDDSFLKVGTSVMIPQTSDVDSLNLTIAVGIGAYEFTRETD
jgi:TrmH family RNA methyltransferase